MKFIDLINESNYEDKPRLQKRAIDFYKHARIRKFKLKQHNTNTFPINNDETIESIDIIIKLINIFISIAVKSYHLFM